MKHLRVLLLLMMAGSAVADDLGDANRLLNEKSYAKAFPIYQRMAEAGNPEAQMRLGEMYWFGDGTASDLGKARTWFAKSAASGNADAAASLASLKRRETHGDEIKYWTTSYDGADMISGKFACKPPVLPDMSRTKAQIKTADAEIQAYSACYNGFVDHLAAAFPAGKAIPAEVIDMMTPAEAQQAQQHLDQVYGRLASDAKRDATAFADREMNWRRTTEAYVNNELKKTGLGGSSLPGYADQRVGGVYPGPDPMNRATTTTTSSQGRN